MQSWKRNPDRDLEAQLRANRPEPRPEITRAIADRLRPRRSGMKWGLHVPLGLAGGVSAIVLTVAIAFGGGGYTLDAASSALHLQNAKQTLAPAGTAGATADQYNSRVTVCFGTVFELRLSRLAAEFLVRVGLATSGPC